MAVAASDILLGAITQMQDVTNVRWTIAELCRYYNDGQRAVATVRPDALVKTAACPLVVGTRQTLPADGVKLIEPVRNTGGTQRAVRMVAREILDAQVPGWHSLPGKAEIVHVMYDLREPLAFYTYPPAALGASLDLTYSAKTVDIAIPAAGAAVTDVAGNLSLSDQFANPLRDYILFRAYSKDATYTANAPRADKHLQLFADQLGIDIKAAVAVAPRSDGNPNMLTPTAPAAS